jgi:hypothetical protein
MFEGPSIGWQAQDTARNFGGHNLIKYNDQLETAPPNTTSNGQTYHWTQFGSSVHTTAVTPPFITNTLVALNPLDTNGGTVGANGLTFTDAGSNGWNTCRANIGVSSGKWYWEYRSVVDTGVMCASIMSKSAPQSDLPGQSSNYGVTYYANGALYKETSGGGTSGWGASFGVTDIIGIALDMNAGKVYFSKNGIWQNSADPVAGTGAASTSLLTYDSVYYPAAATYYAGSVASLNFGNNTFRYGPPAGFLPYAQARSVTKLNSPASGNGFGLINLNWSSAISVTAGKTYTVSVFAKAAEWTRLGIRTYDGANYFQRTTVNLTTGAQITDPGNVAGTTSVVPYGNGWYRVIVTGVCTNTTTLQPIIECHNVSTVQNEEPSNGSGIYVYAAQFEEGSGSEALVITKDQASPIPTSIGNYRTHTYTTVGTSGFTPLVSGNVEVLVVAGGGGGSNYNSAGGGGAGGLIYNANYPVIAGRSYTVVVGAGGVGAMTLSGTYTDAIASATSGSNSQFGTLIAIGGGHGGQGNVQGSRTDQYPSAGGSGGGARESTGTVGAAGTAGQGNKGGAGGTYSGNYPGGGGGGAGAPGGDGIDNVIAGEGGAGLQFSISGTPTWYAGGGAGSTQGSGTNSPGGLGGGGAGGAGTGGSTQNGVSGTANTGGGGGAGGYNNSQSVGGNGGSGIVIVRYRYE